MTTSAAIIGGVVAGAALGAVLGMVFLRAGKRR